MQIVITDNFLSVERRFEHCAEEVPIHIAFGMEGLGDDVKDIIVPAVAAVTPVLSGALQASTEGEVVSDGMDVVINVKQPAVNNAGQEYVQWVVLGHRIVTRGGIDTGRRTEPNDYPMQAIEAYSGAVESKLEEHAQMIASHLLEGL